MAKDNALSTALTYTKDDLVPVPIKVATDVSEQGVELVVVEGSVRKVRSVNDLVLNTGSKEQKQTLVKAKGKGRRNKARQAAGESKFFGNYSLSDSDFQARQVAIICEAEATIQLGALVGVETVGREDEIITDLSRIIAWHSKTQ
ncbi:hypothetical protein V6N13_116262 [Hibiscus sabdariffa]